MNIWELVYEDIFLNKCLSFKLKKNRAFFPVVSHLFDLCTVDHLPFLLSPWMDGCRNSYELELWKLF